MFKKIFVAVIFLGVLVNCSSLGVSTSYELRPYEEKVLPNGLRLIYVKDSSLPYFTIQMLVKTGGANDPMTKSGLSYMVGQLLDKGSSKRSALQISDSLGHMGSGFSASVDDDFSTFSSSSLSTHRNQLITDYSEVLTDPIFSKSELDRVKKLVTSGLKKTVDNPSSFASMIYSSYVYGAHPYGRNVSGTIRDVKSIKRKDVENHYNRFFRPNNAYLTVVGDFTSETKKLIESKFGQWKSRDVSQVQFPSFPKIQGVQVKLVEKKDLAQTQIRMGHKAIKRSDPDFLPLRLAGNVLSGGFASRLFQEIRVKKGLTYSIGARFGAQKDFGSFNVSTFTRHEKVGETITETLRVLNEFRTKGITQEELTSAKALAKGVFPRALETAEKFAFNLLILRFYGLSDDYLKNYYKNIDAISLKQVNSAINKHLDPENIKILVFGPKKETVEQLRPIGLLEVENYERFVR